MEELRAKAAAADWAGNMPNMSMDFRMPSIDDPFKRSRRTRRHGHRSHSHGHSGSGAAVVGPDGKPRENGQHPDNESGSSFYSYSSNESESGSESGSAATETERVPEGDAEKEKKQLSPLPEPVICPSLDWENLAFIDESSDAVSGKVRLDSLAESTQPNAISVRKPKRRRAKRPVHKSPKTSLTKPDKKEPNGDVGPPKHPPPAPPPP